MQKHTAAILNLDTAEAELRETMPTGSPPVVHRLRGSYSAQLPDNVFAGSLSI